MNDHVESGAVCVTLGESADYEKFQVKNHPDTVDMGVTLVMGAPFNVSFLQLLKNLIGLLVRVFNDYDRVRLHPYRDDCVHATVTPIIRTPFDLELYGQGFVFMSSLAVGLLVDLTTVVVAVTVVGVAGLILGSLSFMILPRVRQAS